MIRPIRVDHTKFLQVAIKTHSFITPAMELCGKRLASAAQLTASELVKRAN
jgi:redox-regulated HSP33 family molecular chaperone